MVNHIIDLSGDWDPLLGQGARERQDPVILEKDVPGGGTVQEDGPGQGRRQRLVRMLLRREGEDEGEEEGLEAGETIQTPSSQDRCQEGGAEAR